MASQDDLLCADHFGKLRKIICGSFVRVQGDVVGWDFGSVLYLKLSYVDCQSEGTRSQKASVVGQPTLSTGGEEHRDTICDILNCIHELIKLTVPPYPIISGTTTLKPMSSRSGIW